MLLISSAIVWICSAWGEQWLNQLAANEPNRERRQRQDELRVIRAMLVGGDQADKLLNEAGAGGEATLARQVLAERRLKDREK